jgi:PPIC-type PPIASE domain
MNDATLTADNSQTPSGISSTSARFNSWRQHPLLREPLVHFVVLGMLIFAADQVVLAIRGNPQEIIVPVAAQKEAKGAFVAGMKREPTPADMKILMNRWVDNEVLYREGISLGLDKGDTSIRERVIFKALTVTQSGLSLPKIDEAGLRAWFETKRDRYDQPARFDFQEAMVIGDRSKERMTAFVKALNSQGPSDVESSLSLFKDRPRPNLVQSYGEPFAAALEKQGPGVWAAVDSREGLRVINLTTITAGQISNFDAVKERVFQDWKDDATGQVTQQALQSMARKYRIRGDGFAL